MKFLLMSMLVGNVAFAMSNSPKKTLPVNKVEQVLKKEQAKSKLPAVLNKKEEDCDDKAKKPIEIKEESISLSGNTGCSLDEVKP